ncbi:hypothetical protein DYBT9275_02565 [Dyadobacter sp. CECT 9275]|uniref:histidine kinase n=1 Tax=Dyadobacter helix TaxID=2822344 RepID=A0A916JBJ8_9BACT|nr:PAS domain S-box protein [Dyadobacter sp. CECT 9275]CAG5000953.1 hypothetical protein DYBT9275_02565 [Dyadobacter sp. CECT 9275]
MVIQEQLRLESVDSFLQIDFVRREFQEIVELASKLCDKPVALITLLGRDENWIKVRTGVDAEVMPRKTSFCQYAILDNDLMVVEDATKDERFFENELVVNDPNLRFYAGAPLTLGNGQNVGTLCLFDFKPGHLKVIQRETLLTLARQIVYLMELELSQKILKVQLEEIQTKNESLRKIAFIQSHSIRQPLSSIMGLVELVRSGFQTVDAEWIEMIREATRLLDSRIRDIVHETLGQKDIKALRFSKMVEEIEDYAILLLDRNGNIENWNKGAEILKGYKANEIIGKNFSIFYTIEDREDNLPEKLIATAEKIGFAKSEGFRVRKDGSLFWGSILITAIHDDELEVIGFTKVTRLLPLPVT